MGGFNQIWPIAMAVVHNLIKHKRGVDCRPNQTDREARQQECGSGHHVALRDSVDDSDRGDSPDNGRYRANNRGHSKHGRRREHVASKRKQAECNDQQQQSLKHDPGTYFCARVRRNPSPEQVFAAANVFASRASLVQRSRSRAHRLTVDLFVRPFKSRRISLAEGVA